MKWINRLFKQKEFYKVQRTEIDAIAQMLEVAFQQVVDDYNLPIEINIKSTKVKNTFGFLIEVTDKEPKQQMCH